MDALSDPRVREIVVMSSAQVGKTEMLLNVIGYLVDQDPSPVLLLQPTLEMAEAFSKDRLAPMIRDTPALTRRFADPRSRDSGNTLLHKQFPGGHITLAGANSPASLAMRPIRALLADEVDRYPQSAGAEGNPLKLARKRTTTFWNRILFETSTPTLKGASQIESDFERSDQRRFWVPCPDCGMFQVLRWSQVIWDEGRPESAAYACSGCAVLWDDAQRWSSVKRGEWKADRDFNGIAGFHIWEAYSSWVRLEDTVRGFLEAKRLPDTLRVWVNTALGETWEESGEKVDDAALAARRESFPEVDGMRVVPASAGVLTAGVDVQDNRIEIEIVAWGAGEENWSLEYHILHGDPSTSTLWDDVDAILMRPRLHQLGIRTYIRGACVDTGGHHTQTAYRFCRERHRRATDDGGRQYVFAIKGMAGKRPIWPERSKNQRGGVALYAIGVDTAKEVVTDRLRIETPGPGYCHFPLERSVEWFDQLTAEQVVTRFHKGFPKREWVKRKPRNEAFDCRVYAHSALVGVMTVSATRIEDEVASLREIVQPAAPQQPKASASSHPSPADTTRPSQRTWIGSRRDWLRR